MKLICLVHRNKLVKSFALPAYLKKLEWSVQIQKLEYSDHIKLIKRSDKFSYLI
jgi:hypothetical protein